uniref:Uncharacterized protein n=1 Tax=Amicula sp. isolate GU52X-4 cfCalB7 TaxID=3003489 RepID=A0A9E8Z0P1_9STRA|nr:hypothetical protein [Amicula sp. isolate GU52X-4 cfCalB7]WAK84979.1 hypothetical protein [Amicula sp. isolate GU52X-4 cfCalB7]
MNNNSLEVYFKLLKVDDSLQKKGTSLEKKDRKKYLDLLQFRVKLSDYIHWKQRHQYLNLMKNFVDLKIDGKQFVSQFMKLYKSNQQDCRIFKTDLKQLSTFKLKPESFGFSRWPSELELCCDEFYPDLQPQDRVEFKFARDEENLRNFVATIVPEIKKYCEK